MQHLSFKKTTFFKNQATKVLQKYNNALNKYNKNKQSMT